MHVVPKINIKAHIPVTLLACRANASRYLHVFFIHSFHFSFTSLALALTKSNRINSRTKTNIKNLSKTNQIGTAISKIMTMAEGLGELQPLVPLSSTTYYDDNYTPIDESSEKILKRKRIWVKLGQSLPLLFAFYVVLLLLNKGGKSAAAAAASASLVASIQADHLFAGLLSDEQAFYFPTSSSSSKTAETSPLSRRRSLRAATTNTTNEDDVDEDSNSTKHDIINWSYDWNQNSAKDNANNAAAIGEYYRYKGLALANYYQSRYDPAYKAANDSAAADSNYDATTIIDTWTDDWKADKAHGIVLGEKYQAIGDDIDEHYRKAFADNGKEKNNKNKKYDWESDRDLGRAIGENYKAIGKAIDDHYNSTKDDDGIDWDIKWKEYKRKGKEIAKYYKSKGDAVDEFYKGRVPLEGMARPTTETVLEGAAVPQDATIIDTDTDSSTAAAVSAEDNDNIDTNSNNDKYIWGLDWCKDMEKGISINEYYRAKYDSTYGVSNSASTTTTITKDDEDNVPLHNPDVDFPPWGTNHEVDREHGIAIHEYWKKKHELMKEEYNKTTKDGVNYYEDFYRSKFDPTYKNYNNQN